MKEEKNKAITCVTFLNRGQVDFLDKVSKDYMFKRGHKLPRSQILSDLVNLMMHLEIDLDKVELSEESFWKGILNELKNAK